MVSDFKIGRLTQYYSNYKKLFYNDYADVHHRMVPNIKVST